MTILAQQRRSPLSTPTDLGHNASTAIARGMNAILADVYALYLKTRNFHWHMSAPHCRDYDVLLDEQVDALYALTGPIAERIRNTNGAAPWRIGNISRLQRVGNNNAEYVDQLDMLVELREDNQKLAARLRKVHELVAKQRDIETASVMESWIDDAERRSWFLFESSRNVD